MPLRLRAATAWLIRSPRRWWWTAECPPATLQAVKAWALVASCLAAGEVGHVRRPGRLILLIGPGDAARIAARAHAGASPGADRSRPAPRSTWSATPSARVAGAVGRRTGPRNTWASVLGRRHRRAADRTCPSTTSRRHGRGCRAARSARRWRWPDAVDAIAAEPEATAGHHPAWRDQGRPCGGGCRIAPGVSWQYAHGLVSVPYAAQRRWHVASRQTRGRLRGESDTSVALTAEHCRPRAP